MSADSFDVSKTAFEILNEQKSAKSRGVAFQPGKKKIPTTSLSGGYGNCNDFSRNGCGMNT